MSDFNIQDVLALVRAGFNREEISAMLQPAPAPDPAPAPEPALAPEPAPAPDPAPAPVPDMTALMQRMDELTRSIQSSNIIRDQQPPKETVDDILASIIRPPRRDPNGNT